MTYPVIEISNISKKFSYKDQQPYFLLRDTISGWFSRQTKPKNEIFWALKNLSVNINKGETVGLIGPNGAGKSTLLKIISNITLPSDGEIKIKGRVTSLLEVGTGFNPELTGRENIFLNGTLLGMSMKEIKRKFNEIVEFSGVKKFLDTPIKHYSSGMYLRLAFSIAANLDPEILIIDEVLSVGDLHFQKKSFSKIKELAKNPSTTVILVTHNLDQIIQLCSRSLLLDKGVLIFDGTPGKAVNKYMSRESVTKPSGISTTSSGFISIADSQSKSSKDKNFKIETTTKILDLSGNTIQSVRTGEDVCLQFECKFPKALRGKSFDFGYNIETDTGTHLIINYLSYANVIAKAKEKNILNFKIDKLPLASGNYNINIRLDFFELGDLMLLNVCKIKVLDGGFFTPAVIIHQEHSPLYSHGQWELN